MFISRKSVTYVKTDRGGNVNSVKAYVYRKSDFLERSFVDFLDRLFVDFLERLFLDSVKLL